MLLVTILATVSITINADEVCKDWFTKAGLSHKSKDCEPNCSSTMVDMETFNCPGMCDQLCKAPAENIQQKSPWYMKGLTDGDKAIASKYPKEAAQAYMAKEKADNLTGKIFVKVGKNDESDAFRHFVWSCLLVKELGPEKAKLFLDAHETEPTQPKSEREMDLANNQIGLDYAQKNIGALEINQIEKAALEHLKTRKLKVISPSKNEIPGGYYSN